MFTPLQRVDAGSPAPVDLPQDIFISLILSTNSPVLTTDWSWSWARAASERQRLPRLWPCHWQSEGARRTRTSQDRPAQHIWETLQSEVAGLRVSYIDPKHEVRQYRERMLELARTTLTAEKLALFEEELKSPCYEEVAVFQASAHRYGSEEGVGGRRYRSDRSFAPVIGYRGRLPPATDAAGDCRLGTNWTPLMMLQDPEYTKVLIVALPETTPVLEASALQDDLRRAQIEPFAWVINGSLAAAQLRDPVLQARAVAEIPQIRKVKELLAKRVVLISFQAEEPVGVERLNSLAAGGGGASCRF